MFHRCRVPTAVLPSDTAGCSSSIPPSVSPPAPVVPSVLEFSSESCEEEEVVGEEHVVETVIETLPEPEETFTEIQLNEDPPVESSPLSAVPVEPSVDNDIVDSNLTFRRSTRHRVPPERLQYSILGNPLISVVQSLLQSLWDALSIPSASDTVSAVSVV